MIQIIINLYIATVITALIAFIHNLIKITSFLKRRGIKPGLSFATFLYFLVCFVPIKNIKYGMFYLNGAMCSDEQLEELYKDLL